MDKKYIFTGICASFTFDLLRDLDFDMDKLGDTLILEIKSMGILNGVYRIVTINRATETVKCRKLEEVTCSVDDNGDLSSEKFLLDPEDWKTIVGNSK